jgi:uncharacterized protein (TIGR02231 family)
VTSDADRPTAFAEIREVIRGLVADERALQEERRLLAADVASLHRLTETLLGEFAVDASWSRSNVDAWNHQLDELETRIATLGAKDCELEAERQAVARDLADARRREASLQTVDAVATADMTIELVHAGESSVDVDLGVDYVVPGASWRPWHTARLRQSDAVVVEVTCAGCVWQATGEDWNDVELLFSTERPSLGTKPPTLATDRLRIHKRGPSVSVAARDQNIQTAGLGSSGGPRVAEDELPGIDDGGVALELRSRSRATVPGDGRPCRVPIFSFEAPAQTKLLCVPELAPGVQLRSRQVNAAEQPLLAGPVDLIRNSGLVGRTSILYVAPGERFDLGWGPDRALRVHREVEHLEHQRRTLSSWTRKPRRVTVKLSNLGAEPRDVEVAERIPVSEVEKVEVEVAHASPGAEKDDDGIMRWPVHLRGLGRHELTLEWTLVVHDDVQGL